MVLLGFLAACGDAGQSPAEPPEPAPRVKAKAPAAPVAERSPANPPADASLEGSGQAAAKVAQDYYSLIEKGDLPAALRLREPGRRAPTLERFRANFAKHAEHRSTIGRPSEPVTAGEWVYVEVPVQTYGSFKDGKPFSSAGTITLRRRASGGEWRLYGR